MLNDPRSPLADVMTTPAPAPCRVCEALANHRNGAGQSRGAVEAVLMAQAIKASEELVSVYRDASALQALERLKTRQRTALKEVRWWRGRQLRGALLLVSGNPHFRPPFSCFRLSSPCQTRAITTRWTRT